jgi:3',5'-nucleoside bisphosphate phosphatase
MRVDLHLHSRVSDGDVAPAALPALARAGRLDVIALTDHDTAAGVPEALAAAEGLPLTIIPGIEISTRWENLELHILGYWIDPESPPIQEHQRRAIRRRADRMVAMVARLQGMGIGVTFDDVEAAAGPEVRVLGRPHLARALHAGGHTRFYGEAFLRFIGDTGPAFVAEGFPLPQDAVRTIHAAGGLAVWAHPPVQWFDEGVALMKEWGMDGIEVYRPAVEPADVRHFESGARAHGLFTTGGSDWHGPHRSTLGDFWVEGERVGEVLRHGGVG